MSISIFGKPLEQISFEDVVVFCGQKIKEGLSLDYKKDLSSLQKLTKTLASFANTNGGWVIIGVDDENDVPKEPFLGMQHEENFVQRINNSVISLVTPVVLPECKVVTSGDGKNSFVLAYMPQSPAAPHWMNYDSKNILFTRVGDRAQGQEWEKYATGNEWEMLRHRRQASMDLQRELAEVMKDVFRAQADLTNENEKENYQPAPVGFATLSTIPYLPRPYFQDEEYEGTLTITIYPTYPSQELCSINDLVHVMREVRVSNGMRQYHAETPDGRGGFVSTFQNGAFTYYKDPHNDSHYFFAIDTFGNIMNVDPVEKLRQNPSGKEMRILSVKDAITTVEGVIRFADAFYDRIGLMGSLSLKLDFESKEKPCRLIHVPGVPDEDNPPLNIVGRAIVDRKVDRSVLSNDSSREVLVLELVKKILYSFNHHHFEEVTLTDMIRAAKPLD